MMGDIFIDVNCDIGEGVGNEEALMPLISSCNIACGGHAGNEETMLRVSRLAKEHGVKIGAHPSYPDPENFGRISMELSETMLIKSIEYQMNSFHGILKREDITLNHIKAHGALYRDISRSPEIAKYFLEAIKGYKDFAEIYAPYGSAIEEEALKMGFRVKREAFIDRNYNLDLSLVSRKYAEAMVGNPKDALDHLLRLVNESHVVTLKGMKVHIQADTYGIHSDTTTAVEILKLLSVELPKTNIYIKR